MNNFSIRTLLLRSQNPAPKKRLQCLYLVHVSRQIKDTTGSGENYTDTYYECGKLKRRISSKRKCLNCNFYKPLITQS